MLLSRTHTHSLRSLFFSRAHHKQLNVRPAHRTISMWILYMFYEDELPSWWTNLIAFGKKPEINLALSHAHSYTRTLNHFVFGFVDFVGENLSELLWGVNFCHTHTHTNNILNAWSISKSTIWTTFSVCSNPESCILAKFIFTIDRTLFYNRLFTWISFHWTFIFHFFNCPSNQKKKFE